MLIGKSGSEHPRWKGGIGLNEKGYPRYWAGKHRGKYVHRVVMEGLLNGPIPDGFTIHHQDHNRQHYCPSNLMLLQKCIHDAISLAHARHAERQRMDTYADW